MAKQPSNTPSQPPKASSTPSSTNTSRREARRLADERRQRQRWIAIGVIAVGVIVLVALIYLVTRPTPLVVKSVSTTQPASASGTAWGGSADQAKVVIAEYSDFQCPFCGRHALTTLPALIERYGNNPNVRYEFHPYSFIGPESKAAAAAALCSAEQEKFWPMHDTIYANQNGENVGTFSKANLRMIAQAAGLDMGVFNDCFDSGRLMKDVNNFLAEGQKLGVQSTPTFFVNGQQLLGALPAQDFYTAIDQALANVGAS